MYIGCTTYTRWMYAECPLVCTMVGLDVRQMYGGLMSVRVDVGVDLRKMYGGLDVRQDVHIGVHAQLSGCPCSAVDAN